MGRGSRAAHIANDSRSRTYPSHLPSAAAQRLNLVREALHLAKLDALVCAFPSNVLMLTGYWPVVGTSVAAVSADGRAIAIVPEDERELAERGWAEVRTFQPSSLDKLVTASEMLVDPLRQVLRDLRLEKGRIGYGDGPVSQPASYAAMHIYGGAMADVLENAAASAELEDAEKVIHKLRAVKTAYEIGCIRRACEVAGEAFQNGRRALRVPLASSPAGSRTSRPRLCGRDTPTTAPGTAAVLREVDVAAIFRSPLSTRSADLRAGSKTRAPEDHVRQDGFMFCMSGPNAAQAYGAYARSRTRQIRSGDLVLVHCNSYVGGYWTDITRTYCMGEPDKKQRKLYEAVFAARQAALQALRPGAKGSEVDAAARRVLAEHGYKDQFKHSTGHGVGFGAIDANALPRLHPKSPDVLEPGMVFNLEPAIYLDGYGGIRHCDVVALTERGAEVLTPFQASVEELTVV